MGLRGQGVKHSGRMRTGWPHKHTNLYIIYIIYLLMFMIVIIVC